MEFKELVEVEEVLAEWIPLEVVAPQYQQQVVLVDLVLSLFHIQPK